MRLLLDTHAVVWSFIDIGRLSAAALAAVKTPGHLVCVSVASAWEIAINVGKGKWPEAQAVLVGFESHLARANFRLLPIELDHVRAAGLMATAHRDPFDRLLAAQAIGENLTLVTADPQMPSLGAAVLW